MTQKELIKALAGHFQWSESKTAEVLEAIVSVLSDQLSENNEIYIEAFGVFRIQKEAEYISVNPETNERYLMPPKIEIVFEEASEGPVEESELDNRMSFDDGANESKPIYWIGFEPDEALRNRVNSSFRYFEPTLLNEGVQFPGISVVKLGEKDMQVDLKLNVQQKLQNEPEVQAEPKVNDSQDFSSKESPPSISRYHSGSKTEKRRKTSSIWIPVIGGVAIALASLFFFKGDPDRKSGNDP